MKLLPFVLLVALLTLPAAAEYQLAVTPPAPVEGEPFMVRVTGGWRDSCVPRDATLFLTSRTIIPTFTRSGNGCPPAVTPFEAEVAIPGRPRGEHRLVVRFIDFDGTVRELGRSTVTVSGSSANVLEHVVPDFGPAGTRTHLRILGSFSCPSDPCPDPRVWLGEREADQVQLVDGRQINAYTPLGASPGEVVDVVVRRGDHEWRLPGGFRYLLPDEFEPILVPIWLRTDTATPGAHGSLWQSRFRFFNGHEVELLLGADLLRMDQAHFCQIAAPCIPFRIDPGVEFDVPNDSTHEPWIPAGIIYVHRTLTQQIGLQARVRDVSRRSTTWGTEVPLVRGSEIPLTTQRLLDVPLGDSFRVMLRLYGVGGSGLVSLKIADPATGAVLIEESVPLRLPPGSLDPWSAFPSQPSYAEIRNLQSRPELAGRERVRIDIVGTGKRVWGMASITHEETQHVTLVTPQ